VVGWWFGLVGFRLKMEACGLWVVGRWLRMLVVVDGWFWMVRNGFWMIGGWFWMVSRGWLIVYWGVVVLLALVLNCGLVTVVVCSVGHDLNPAIRQGNPVLTSSRVPRLGLLMTVIVAVVRSFHTVHKLIVCLFMCGVGVYIMVSRLDMLDRLSLIDWRWERVLDFVVGGEGGGAVAGVDLEQGQGVGDHIHAHGEGGEGEEGHLEGW